LSETPFFNGKIRRKRRQKMGSIVKKWCSLLTGRGWWDILEQSYQDSGAREVTDLVDNLGQLSLLPFYVKGK
jgi:hypothetical protein